MIHFESNFCQSVNLYPKTGYFRNRWIRRIKFGTSSENSLETITKNIKQCQTKQIPCFNETIF